jgi:protein-disulfide isomerase/uncharacterized membrane protein
MTSRARVTLIVASLLGLAVTGYATYVHVNLLRTPGFIAFCDINDTFSCTSAYLSQYGSFAGLPVALLGACWFALTLFLLLSAKAAGVPNDDHVPGYLFALSVPALAFALYLGYAAFFILKTVCVMCVLTYVSIAVIFVVSGMTTKFSLTSLPARFGRDLKALVATPAALIAAVLFVAGAASALAFFPRESGAAAATPAESEAAAAAASAPIGTTEQDQLEKYLSEAPRAMIPVDSPATVVIVKFNDYQCPPCRQTFDMYKPLKAKWDKEAPGKVKFVTKDFPLETECNASIKGGVHQLACEAAAAVRMARANGKSDALEDWIFANQQGLTLDGLKKAVIDIGGVKNFDQQYPTVLTDVRGDTALGGLLGVNQTPTFYLNGVKLPPLQPEYLNAAIAIELKRAAK